MPVVGFVLQRLAGSAEPVGLFCNGSRGDRSRPLLCSRGSDGSARYSARCRWLGLFCNGSRVRRNRWVCFVTALGLIGADRSFAVAARMVLLVIQRDAGGWVCFA